MSDTSGNCAMMCSGGGSAGAYQVGVLKYIHEHFCNGGSSPFSIFTGTSCGSLNACFLASHSHNAESEFSLLEELWRNFHIPRFHRKLRVSLMHSILRGLRAAKRSDSLSILDSTPVWDVVRRGFDRVGLEKAFAVGSTTGFGVAATELVSGYPVWFVDGPNATPWNRFHSIGQLTDVDVQHVVASCSIPFFFPAVEIGSHYFLDGSVNITRPFSAAISMGATRVLAIRTSDPEEVSLPTYRPGFRPTIRSLLNFLLKVFLREFTVSEIQQIEVLNRLSEAAATPRDRFQPSPTRPNAVFDSTFQLRDYQPISILTISPTVHPKQMLDRLCLEDASLRTSPGHEFMFHRKYIGRLIDQGYEDGKAKHGELDEFFTSQSTAIGAE